jgi:hypothetical protein
MAQHGHGLICSKLVKLYKNVELMEKGSELVMSWMGCVATSVMGPRLILLSEDSTGPLSRMPKVWKEGIVYIDGILELPKRNRSLLLSTLFPLQHEHVMHTDSSRCIPHVRIGKGDNFDCAGGFKHGPPNQ